MAGYPELRKGTLNFSAVLDMESSQQLSIKGE